MLVTFTKNHPRLTNHLLMAAITLAGCIIALGVAMPSQSFLEMLSVGTGYIGLFLIATTLLIGPFNMLKVRKNPVNIMFRRDVGIWAGITSLAHVLFAFALELNWGGTLLGFFFYKDGTVKLNLFGVSNFIGLIAALVISFLLVLSNNYFLKNLKGKRWKAMQRFNYLLFAVGFLHTFTQQINNGRGALLVSVVLGGVVLVLGGQLIGYTIYQQRANLRKDSQPAPARQAPTAFQNGATRPANPYLSLPQRQVPPPQALRLNQSTGGNSNREILGAFGLTTVLGLIVAFLGFNVLNEVNASNSNSPNTAFNNSGVANGQDNNQNGFTSNGNNNNNSVNSVANGNSSNSNPFNGSSRGNRNGSRGRGNVSVNPPSGSSSPIHTGGS